MSHMTVSRALRQHPNVSPETRDRVLAEAQKRAYRPDPELHRLMSHLRQGKHIDPTPLAVLSGDATREGWRKWPVNVAMERGAQLRAQSYGYRLEHFWLLAPGMNPRRLGRILKTRGIRGILLLPLPEPADLEWDWAPFSTAALGYTLRSPALHRATANHLQLMQLACRNIDRLGYRRQGLALPSSASLRVNQQWLAGYMLWQLSVPVSHRVNPLISDDFTLAEFRSWYEREKPDAVLGGLAAWTRLREMNLKCPEDLGFALVNIEEDRQLSGIDQRCEEQGAVAIDLIATQLQTYRSGIPFVQHIVQVEACWHEGKSLRSLDRNRASVKL